MFWTRTRSFSPRATLRSHFDIFNRYFGAHNHDDAVASFPAFNVWSNEEGAMITSELPGVSIEDIEITAAGNGICVKGTRKEGSNEEKNLYLRRERPEGEFTRAIELPFKIEASGIDASLVNGVLRIRLPRAENDKPRRIAINVN